VISEGSSTNQGLLDWDLVNEVLRAMRADAEEGHVVQIGGRVDHLLPHLTPHLREHRRVARGVSQHDLHLDTGAKIKLTVSTSEILLM
jgi:hypothetical protein